MFRSRGHRLNQYFHLPKRKVKDRPPLAPWVMIRINFYFYYIEYYYYSAITIIYSSFSRHLFCLTINWLTTILRIYFSLQGSILWTILVYEWIMRMHSLMLASGNSTIYCLQYAVWYISIQRLVLRLYPLFCRRPHAIFKCHQRIRVCWRPRQCWVCEHIYF